MARDILPLLDTVATWLKGVQDYTLNQALAGIEYPGFKLVAGRSNRKITDTEAAKKALLDAGFAEDAIMKPQEMRGITDLEKLVGKKRFGVICKPWIVKPQGKLTLGGEHPGGLHRRGRPPERGQGHRRHPGVRRPDRGGHGRLRRHRHKRITRPGVFQETININS